MRSFELHEPSSCHTTAAEPPPCDSSASEEGEIAISVDSTAGGIGSRVSEERCDSERRPTGSGQDPRHPSRFVAGASREDSACVGAALGPSGQAGLRGSSSTDRGEAGFSRAWLSREQVYCTVLPNIRDFYIVGGVEVPSDIESESLVETIVDSEEERDEPIVVEDGPLDFAVRRELERVSSSSTVEHIRLIERREAPDVLRPQLIFPPLPGWRQWELEVQIEDGLARIHPQTRLVVSWDFHQVLDCFRVSSRQREHCENGRLPSQVQDTLARVAALSSNPTQIVTSYCNHPSTVYNVFKLCRPQPEFAKIVVTRKPAGRVGKLQTLLQLIDTSRCFLLHVDDSPEVVTEWREYIDQNPGCNLAICGIIVPRKARDSIADYRGNVYEVWNSIRGGRFG